MDLINILVWIIVGAIAGWLASIVMKTNSQQGLLLDIVVGIIGGFIGGIVLNLLGIGGGCYRPEYRQLADGFHRRGHSTGPDAAGAPGLNELQSAPCLGLTLYN